MFSLFLLLHAQAQPPDSAAQKALNQAKAGDTVQLPAGSIYGPLRVEGAENLRIVAQPDTVLICGAKEPVPCLLIAESQSVVFEGLMVQGREAGASIILRESSVELTGLRLHRGYVELEDAELLLHHSTLSDIRHLAPNCSGECGMELSDSYIVGSLLGGGSVHFPDWMQVHHNTLYLNQGDWSGPNCHHNLIAEWVPQRPAMSRNLRVHDPDFVDAGSGDLRLFDTSPIMEDFGVRGPRVRRDAQLGFQVGTTREVLGWSADSKLLVYSEDIDTGHGMCASSLQLWDARNQGPVEAVGCSSDEGPFDAQDLALSAVHYAPVLKAARAAGTRSDLGTVAQIQTRSTLLESENTEQGQERQSQLWIDRGQQGLDPWWRITEDYEFGVPETWTELTRSPDGKDWVWVMGDHLTSVQELPKPQSTCGVEGVRRGERILPEKNNAELYIVPGEERWGGHSGPIRYGGRVSCEVSGEEAKAGVWVQALDRMDQVFWVHSSQLLEPSAWTDPVNRPAPPEVSFSSPQAPRPLDQDSIDHGWAVLGWSSDGVVLTHAGLAPTVLASTTTLFDTGSSQSLGTVAHTWEEHRPDTYKAEYWKREAAFAELLALANAKGIRRDAGHTRKVEMAPMNAELGVCLNDGAGWRRFSTSEPVLVDVDTGPWLSTGPSGAQVLVTDEGQVVLLTPAEAPCP